MSDKTSQARLDIFVRLIGLIFVATGGATAYFAATTPLIPQLAPFFYLIATILIISGVAAVIAKLS